MSEPFLSINLKNIYNKKCKSYKIKYNYRCNFQFYIYIFKKNAFENFKFNKGKKIDELNQNSNIEK